MDFVYTLPKKYRNKPIGKIFKEPDSKYGVQDVRITVGMRCQKCKCHLPITSRECTRCKSKRLRKYFSIETCPYTTRCSINRWGCSIHFRGGTNHGPVCVCDECM